MTIEGGPEGIALQRELERLREENRRMSRLLELRGGEIDLVPEQTVAALHPNGPVSMASPAAHKVALFSDLFRARTDVYAVRWENARTGAQGWMPAVAGGWKKGMDRQRARHLPLTDDVIASHLLGDVFIGLYPLRRDNTCQFLVADFDGAAAMLDALAYVKAARASGVPAALEISQSGRGAHVWIYFREPVAARIARTLGTVLIREAITLRGSMDLRSYDRLFPNQDVLPDGGFGNLIAAPLQGQRRKDGLTLFLDLATLEPYPDQWDFLSGLDRVDPGDVARLAQRAERAAVGSEVAILDRSTATKVHPRLPAVIPADLGAGLSIDATHLSPAALSTLKHAASMANPKFYELQRLRKSTWDTPRFVRGYDFTLEDRLVLPRGLRQPIAQILADGGSQLQVVDQRNSGTEIDVALAADLSATQADAVSAMLAHDDGVLVAPPGSGKTVMACAIAAERGTSTIVLVDRKALAEQWRERIEHLLGFKPGQLGGGRRKLSGRIDVAMLPSLARRDDVGKLLAGYGHVIVDECHHLAAAAYEHSVKQVGAQFWLGLTATPKRRDGLGEIVSWQLGPVRHTMEQEQPGTFAEVWRDDDAPERVLHIHETDFTIEGIELSEPGSLAAVHHSLAHDEDRNHQIVADIGAAQGQGRNCLVLTRRVAHVDQIRHLLSERGLAVLVLQGGMSVKDRRAVMERLAKTSSGDGVVVVGTTPFIGEGFDAPALDTLFLAAPISFDGLLVQCAGRVVRSAPGKTRAEVHDYHDVSVPVLASSLPRRRPGYRALGFTER